MKINRTYITQSYRISSNYIFLLKLVSYKKFQIKLFWYNIGKYWLFLIKAVYYASKTVLRDYTEFYTRER